MKRFICLILCAVLLLTVLTGCSGGNTGKTSRTNSQVPSVNDVLTAGIQAQDPTTESTETTPEDTNLPVRKSGLNDNAPIPQHQNSPVLVQGNSSIVDVDLTILSATMVYSEVFNMMSVPEEYIGKTIKMKGLASSMYDQATENTYYACIVQDATACCSQGIEFVLSDDYSAADYPQMGDEITVMGVFDTYQEGDYTYCTLRDANLL